MSLNTGVNSSSGTYHNPGQFGIYPTGSPYNSTLPDSSLIDSIPTAPPVDDINPLLDSNHPYSQVFQSPTYTPMQLPSYPQETNYNNQQQQPYYQQQQQQTYYPEYYTYQTPYVPAPSQPRLPTHPCLVNRVAQVPLKLIGGLCFGALSVLCGGSAFIAGTTTSILFAVGNPSCLLTGIFTLGLAAGAGKCMQVALKVLAEAGKDFNELMS